MRGAITMNPAGGKVNGRTHALRRILCVIAEGTASVPTLKFIALGDVPQR